METGLILCFLVLFGLCSLIALEDVLKEPPVLGEEWDFTRSFKSKPKNFVI